jgi:hypothetical protein
VQFSWLESRLAVRPYDHFVTFREPYDSALNKTSSRRVIPSVTG